MSSLLGELQGSQRPRLECFPLYASSAGEDAVDLAAVAGLELDEWQAYVLENALGEKAGGRWAAFEVALIVPRQNGKNALLEARELAGALLFGETDIVHTAHEFKTCTDAFNKTWKRISESPLAEYVKGWDGDADARQIPGVKRAHGFESIEFVTGSTIRFMTRTANAGRGFTADFLALDEAYALKPDQMAAILPTMSAKTISGNPQIWYTSSAGMPSSETLEAIRARGVGSNPGRLAFFEWSADPEADPDDPAAWAVANPALGVRISSDFVETERATMPEEQFKRERLGIWASEQDDPAVIDAEVWGACLDESSRPGERVVFAVDVTPKRDAAVVVAASARPDGVVHVEVAAQNEGPWWVAPWLAERLASGRFPHARVVVDNASGAAALVPELLRHKVSVQGVNFREYSQACGVFFDAVKSGRIAHIGQSQLDEAVENARVKPTGDSSWKWIRRAPGDDISPLVAASLAVFAVNRDLRPAAGRRKRRRVILC